MQDPIAAKAEATLAAVAVAGTSDDFAAPRARFDVVCYDADGNEKWRDTAYNLVTTQGKNDLLDKYFAGSAYTATWYCGLISSVSYTAVAVTDTAANMNNTVGTPTQGWREAGPSFAPNYTAANRVALAFSAASAGSKATSAASSFTFNAAGTIKGMFGASSNVKDGTAGVLYNAVLFSGGDRTVANLDVVNVSVTYTAS